MIFRQLIDYTSHTYTYLLGGKRGGEAIIIDPVLDKVDRYLQLLAELDLKLLKAVDTHVHADHITGLGELRDRTGCITVAGNESSVDVVSMRISDGDEIAVDCVSLKAISTPGHTDDSYSFLCENMLFTGDTLFIRGTGRTDFQNGCSRMQYNSLFNKLLKLPDETLVYPGHNYNGETVSTIYEEKMFNPRLQVSSEDEYVALMAGLKLDNPKMMDVAVPANLHIGLSQDELELRGHSYSCKEAESLCGNPNYVFADLRDVGERRKHGILAGSVHAPYTDLDENIESGGMLRELAQAKGAEVVFYCAFGERSAMAVKKALEAGLNAKHVKGGIDAWKKANLTLESVD